MYCVMWWRCVSGGKTEDFLSAAKLFYRAKRQVKVPTYLVPATQKVRVWSGLLYGGLCRVQFWED